MMLMTLLSIICLWYLFGVVSLWSSREFHVRVVLFFHSPRFFPLGFTLEGFLRRQSHMVFSCSLDVDCRVFEKARFEDFYLSFLHALVG